MTRPFGLIIPANAFSLLLIEALLISASFATVTFLVLAPEEVSLLLLNNGWGRFAVALFSILLVLYFRNLYGDALLLSRMELLQQLCFALGAAFILQAVVAYGMPSYRVPIRIMLPGGFLSMAAIFLLRLFYSRHFLQMARWDRLLFVGSSPCFAELSKFIEDRPETGMGIVGFVGEPAEAGNPDKWIGSMESLPDAVQTAQPRRIIVGTPGRINAALSAQLLSLRFAGYNLEDADGAYERILGRISLDSITPARIFEMKEVSDRDLRLQRIWNSAVALACVLLLSPLLLLATALARVAFSGAILSREARVGFGGRVFEIYRFRSDFQNARFPLVARALRRLRLERLPALLNILNGDLALVGPAPDRPAFGDALSREIPFYRHRTHVRPGITGWAQIHRQAGSETVPDTLRQLEYDLYYVKNVSLSLDMLILLQAAKLALIGGWSAGPEWSDFTSNPDVNRGTAYKAG